MTELNEIKKVLTNASDEKYREFSSKLINNSALPLLGVRLPELRKIAADVYKNGEAQEFLDACDFSSVEMCLLYSYVLGKVKGDIGSLLPLFDRAAAKVDNWCTCDILCQSFKQSKNAKPEVFAHMLSFLSTGETFYMRIAVVMMMCHFLNDEYIDRVLEALNKYKNDGYYYKMGAAWCTASAMAKYPEKTYNLLENCKFDDWTFNKAIQKMLESRCIPDSDKIKLKAMKRKKPMS